MTVFDIFRARTLVLSLLLGLSFSGDVLAQAEQGYAKRRDGQGQGLDKRGGGQGLAIHANTDAILEAIRTGDFMLAEELARKHVENSEKVPTRQKSMMLGLLGNTLRLNGKLRESENFLRQAQELRDQEFGRNSKQAIRNQIVLGTVLSALGKLAEADRIAEDTIQRQLAGNPGSADLLYAYSEAADVKRELGSHEAAEKLLSAGLAARIVSELDWLPVRRGMLRVSYVDLMVQQKRYAEAADMAREALADFKDDRPRSAIALNWLAHALRGQGRLDEAERTARQALSVSEQSNRKGHKTTSAVRANLAGILALRGDALAADGLFRQATADNGNAGSPQVQISMERRYAMFLATQNRLEDALQRYRNALDLIDNVFAQTQGLNEATRENFVAQYSPYYRETLLVLLRLHRAKPTGGYDREALSVVSRTQSRLFTEMLRQADVGKFAKDPAFARLREQQVSLTRRIADLRQRYVLRGGAQNQLDEESGSKAAPDPVVQARIDEAVRQAGQELADAEQALVALEAQLWEHFPRYMELAQPRPMAVDMLRKQLLKPDETLLTYFMLPQSVLIFSVSREHFRMTVVPQQQGEIARLIGTVRHAEEQAGSSFSALAKLDPELLHRLYQLLVQPVEDRLREGQRLLVIGDGPIHTLPLEMLVTRYGEAEKKAFAAARAEKLFLGEYATLPYLARRYQFAYLPSLSALTSVRLYQKAKVPFGRNIVSFADPVFEKGDGNYGPTTRSALAAISRSVAGSGAISIPRLPETADEAREIARILGGRNEMYLRDKAQEHTAKTADLRDVRYLHFATHGLLGGEFVQVSQAMAANEGGNGRQRNLAVNVAAPPPQSAASPPADDIPFDDESEWHRPAPRETGQPALVLTLSGNLRGEDGLLTMSEVLESMDLNADLVVLSACNTAGENAQAGNGEGFAGLTRAFMFAGARSLIVSHWSVESQATQALMTETFRRLKGGSDGLVALHEARLAIAGSNASVGGTQVSRAHPYFWAPFVYVGD